MISIAACKSASEAPPMPPMILEPTLVTQDAAVPDAAEVVEAETNTPVAQGELRFEVRSRYVDPDARTSLYAGELVWVGEAERPFVLREATADDWKAVHVVLKVKRYELVKGPNQAVANLGIHVFPNHAVPDINATNGKIPNSDFATYDNIKVPDTWRFCFGGHVGTGATMKKCIFDTDAMTATTYDVKTPRAE